MQPLEVREIGSERTHKAAQLAIWSPICSKKLQGVVKLAGALESGRYVARDIGKYSDASELPEIVLVDVFFVSEVTWSSLR